MARQWSTPEEQERAEFMGRLLFHMGKRTVETVDDFKRVAGKDLNRLKRSLGNPFGPYDKTDFLVGSAAVGAMYFTQAAMILWGPPPVKAAGFAWALFPVPADTAIVFGLGVKYNPF